MNTEMTTRIHQTNRCIGVEKYKAKILRKKLEKLQIFGTPNIPVFNRLSKTARSRRNSSMTRYDLKYANLFLDELEKT